ncbi:hypothetical protein P8452_66262 [Trifolium repens]|nr:hypothetical protein P8452_66262 [Trifolium repens]
MTQLFNPWNSRDNLAAKVLSGEVTWGNRPRPRCNRIHGNFSNKSTRGEGQPPYTSMIITKTGRNRSSSPCMRRRRGKKPPQSWGSHDRRIP